MNEDPMTPSDENHAAIRALLDALPRRQGALAAPEIDELVRWLDGTLPPERVAAVDSALAQDPDLRHALTALRLAPEETIPADELARLENLVTPPQAQIVVFPIPIRRNLLVAAAAAAVLLIPAWKIGTAVAEQQVARETRELRAFLSAGFAKGGL